MNPDRSGLDTYLQSVNEDIQTTKISSEHWFRSPSARQIRRNDRFVRSLLAEGLAMTPSSAAEGIDPSKPEPPVVECAYWQAAERAQTIAVSFGAAGHSTLAEYFTVDVGRSGEAALARIRQAVTPMSPADYLLRSIDQISAELGFSPADSCRTAMSLLSQCWPELIRICRMRSGSDLKAADLVREFHDSIETRIGRPHNLAHASADQSDDDPPVLLTKAEARELATLYMLSRYCFTLQEYAMAKELVAMPRLRSAILATLMQLTTGSLKPLDRLISEYRTLHVMLPFTEAFVNRHGYGTPQVDLSPNPKLITVICNNIAPAIGGVLLQKGARAEDLDSEAIRAGVIAAKRRHTFEIMIALFQQVDSVDSKAPDTVAMSGFSMRVCPAVSPISAFLEEWLPYHFDRFS